MLGQGVAGEPAGFREINRRKQRGNVPDACGALGWMTGFELPGPQGGTMFEIPTEPVGSIPRPVPLLDAIERVGPDDPSLDPMYEAAVKDTVACFEATGSPVITDGEQRKYHNFWTYAVHGLPNTAPDGFAIPFTAGHTRRMPRLTAGPFRYRRYADSYLDVAARYAHD